jgi:hypothetical protein
MSKTKKILSEDTYLLGYNERAKLGIFFNPEE